MLADYAQSPPDGALSEGELIGLLSLSSIEHLHSGESLFEVGDRVRGVFVVYFGSLRVWHPTCRFPFHVGPGDIVGEEGWIERARYLGRAIAVEPTTLHCLSPAQLQSLSETDVSLSCRLMRVLARAIARPSRGMSHALASRSSGSDTRRIRGGDGNQHAERVWKEAVGGG